MWDLNKHKRRTLKTKIQGSEIIRREVCVMIYFSAGAGIEYTDRVNLPHIILMPSLNVLLQTFHHRPVSKLSFFHPRFALAEMIPSREVEKLKLNEPKMNYYFKKNLHFRVRLQ